MANKKHSYQGLSPEGLSKTGAIIGFISWIVGVLWHGIGGQPSVMGVMYSMPYMSSTVLLATFLLLVVGGFVLGWLVAAVYNRMIQR